jgi:regulator of sigma E protease
MNETVLTWIIFILAFGGMVIVHELGHFLAALLVKVEVEEFGIGFPTPGAVAFWINKGYLFLRNGKRVEIPSNFRMPVRWNELVDHDMKITVDEVDGRFILRSMEVVVFEETKQIAAQSKEDNKTTLSNKLVKVGKTNGVIEISDVIAEVHPGTRFTFNWLPFGGFVRPAGENDPNVPGGLAASAPWKRLFVLFAGPIMNLITALIVISIIIGRMGGIISSSPATGTGPQRILVTEVVPGNPADQAGLLTGDILLTANGKQLNSTQEASDLIKANPDTPIVFEVLRNGKTIQLSITPLMNAQEGRPMIGVVFCDGCEFKPITTISENLKYSLQITGAQIHALVTLPINMLRGSIDPAQGRLVGLKGIFDILSQSVSNDVEASQAQPASAAPSPYNAPVQTLSIIAMLSISLGIFNLFPFPALDGGRIIFVIPEMIFRRRIPQQFENLVHGVGMAILLLLMIYINVRDFIDPISTSLP